MRDLALPPRRFRQSALWLLTLGVILFPDSVFSIVSDTPWEVLILRMLVLVGVSLLAVLPWVSRAQSDVRRRLRWWSIPGLAASLIYLVSADPLYLFVGFCLLVGGSVDVWMARAHIASGSLRTRLTYIDRGSRAERE